MRQHIAINLELMFKLQKTRPQDNKTEEKCKKRGGWYTETSA